MGLGSQGFGVRLSLRFRFRAEGLGFGGIGSQGFGVRLSLRLRFRAEGLGFGGLGYQGLESILVSGQGFFSG